MKQTLKIFGTGIMLIILCMLTITVNVGKICWIDYLRVWCLGYFIVPYLPKPETKLIAGLQLFLGGPLIWITFPFVLLSNWFSKNETYTKWAIIETDEPI